MPRSTSARDSGGLPGVTTPIVDPGGAGRPTSGGTGLGSFQLLEDGVDRHDVTLELELGVVETGRHADQLREVENRHLVGLAGRRLELLLPGVEREMAERARRHHRVGPRFERLLDWLDQLAESELLTSLDDWKAAALDLRGIVDRLAAAGFDDR